MRFTYLIKSIPLVSFENLCALTLSKMDGFENFLKNALFWSKKKRKTIYVSIFYYIFGFVSNEYLKIIRTNGI